MVRKYHEDTGGNGNIAPPSHNLAPGTFFGGQQKRTDKRQGSNAPCFPKKKPKHVAKGINPDRKSLVL